MGEAVRIQGLRKVYPGGIRAVDGVSLKIREGEVFGLLGPNGAGKTTLLHMLATLLQPSSGSAWVNGYHIVHEAHMVRRSIGIVFQDPSSDDLLTGFENMRLHGLMFGVPREVLEVRIKRLLRLVEMEERAHDLVRHYSGGMRRRLELARGLLHSPRVLFLDEPTLGLDPGSRERVWGYIQELVRQQDISIVITTHYMEEAERLCDRVAIIDMGRIVVLDSPERLKERVGGEVLRLGIRNPNLDHLDKDYVLKVEARGDYLYLTVKDAGRHLQEILAGIGEVDSVELRTPTLNDVFLHFTGREIREGSPEGGYGARIMRARAKR